MSGQRVAYIRVSSSDQNPDRQLAGMTYDKAFIDRATGANVERPELIKLLSYVRAGDILVVQSMDRLARNLEDLRSLVSNLNGRGVKVEFVKESLMFSGDDSPMSRLLLSVMGAFAEFERELIKERQKEGIALAKARGAYKGRKPSLEASEINILKARISAGENKSQVAKDFGITRATLYAYLKK